MVTSTLFWCFEGIFYYHFKRTGSTLEEFQLGR